MNINNLFSSSSSYSNLGGINSMKNIKKSPYLSNKDSSQGDDDRDFYGNTDFQPPEQMNLDENQRFLKF